MYGRFWGEVGKVPLANFQVASCDPTLTVDRRNMENGTWHHCLRVINVKWFISYTTTCYLMHTTLLPICWLQTTGF